MKREGKYITTNILLACLSKPLVLKKDIHTQLSETIAERKRIMEHLEYPLLPTPLDSGKSIHAQLEETIGELRRVMQLSGKLLSPKMNNGAVIDNKQAA